MDETLKEFGKQLLNIGVAVLVFVIIQPFASGSLNEEFVIKGILGYILITGAGLLLIKKGKDMEERE